MSNPINILEGDYKSTVNYSSEGTMFVVRDGVVIQVQKVEGKDYLQLKTNCLAIARTLAIESLKKHPFALDLDLEQARAAVTMILYGKPPAYVVSENGEIPTTACFQMYIDHPTFTLLCESLSIQYDRLALNINGTVIL